MRRGNSGNPLAPPAKDAEAVGSTELTSAAEDRRGSSSTVLELFSAMQRAGSWRSSDQGSKAPLKSSVLGASFNLTNTVVGAGIIGMPWAVEQSGIVGGIFFISLIAWITDLTLRMIIACGDRMKTLDYDATVEAIFGRRARLFCTATMGFFAYGAMVTYAVIIGDTVGTIAYEEPTQGQRAGIIFGFSLVAILPLCLLRNMSQLSSSSSLSILCVLTLVGLIIGLAPASAEDQDLDPPEFTFVRFESLPRGIGAIGFAFVCHHSAFTVRNSLQNPTPERWAKVTNSSIGFSYFIVLFLGLAGYSIFGDAADGDILNSFEDSDVGADVARGFLAVTMVFTFPMEHFIVRHIAYLFILEMKKSANQAAEASLLDAGIVENPITPGIFREESSRQVAEVDADHSDGATIDPADSTAAAEPQTPPMPLKYLYGLTLVLWGSATCIAMSTNDLGFLLSLIGALGASIIGYMFPAAMYYQTFKEELSTAQKAGLAILFVFGVVTLVIGTATTIESVV